MSLFVQRDESGNIIYVMDQPQTPALEEVANDDAGALAWLVKASQPPLDDQIDAYRDQRLSNGFFDSVTNKTWQLDTEAKANLQTILSVATVDIATGNPTQQRDIWASDNIIFQMASSDIVSLIVARIFPWGSATMAYARQMKNSVDAGNPPADITQGWP